jgi:glutamine amidotransferase
MNKVAIIDYDCGNIFSLGNALKMIDQPFDLVANAADLSKYDHAILPGVGSFGPAILALKQSGFDYELREFYSKGKSVFGICLGMQLMLSVSYESGEFEGLNLIEGKVEKISPCDNKERIPNIGWSSVQKNVSSHCNYGLFDTATSDFKYYFIHSYCATPDNPYDIACTISYGGQEITAAISRGNTIGVQFHPEKSGRDGLAFLTKIKSAIWI